MLPARRPIAELTMASVVLSQLRLSHPECPHSGLHLTRGHCLEKQLTHSLHGSEMVTSRRKVRKLNSCQLAVKLG